MSKINPVAAAIIRKNEQDSKNEINALIAELDENEYYIFTDETTYCEKPIHRDTLHRMLESGKISMDTLVLGKGLTGPNPICFTTYPDSLKKQAKKARKQMLRELEDAEPVSGASDAVAGCAFGCLGAPLLGLLTWKTRARTKGERRQDNKEALITLCILILFIVGILIYGHIEHDLFDYLF